ncbi:MAG: hypothetical protein WA231_03525 [Methylocella sp.]
MAQLIGTNHGPSDFAYRELARAGARNGRPTFALLKFNARAALGNACGGRDRHETQLEFESSSSDSVMN